MYVRCHYKSDIIISSKHVEITNVVLTNLSVQHNYRLTLNKNIFTLKVDILTANVRYTVRAQRDSNAHFSRDFVYKIIFQS